MAYVGYRRVSEVTPDIFAKPIGNQPRGARVWARCREKTEEGVGRGWRV